MKKYILSVMFALAVFLPVLSKATDLTITMNPPSTYVDGTPILGADTITCNLYGAPKGSPLAKTASGPCTSFVRSNISPGTVACYAATAVSSLFGTESDQTPTVCVTVQAPAPKSQPTSPPSTPVITQK
jgi:hypothetical protein